MKEARGSSQSVGTGPALLNWVFGKGLVFSRGHFLELRNSLGRVLLGKGHSRDRRLGLSKARAAYLFSLNFWDDLSTTLSCRGVGNSFLSNWDIIPLGPVSRHSSKRVMLVSSDLSEGLWGGSWVFGTDGGISGHLIFAFCTPQCKIYTPWIIYYVLAPMLWILKGMEVFVWVLNILPIVLV